MYSIGGPLRRKVTKRREVVGADEINITPVMNLFVSLIPFLLISAVFVQINIIETNAPSRVSRPAAGVETSLAVVVITQEGFTVSGSGPIMRGAQTKVEIPKRNSKNYNFGALTQTLMELKKNDPKANDLLIMTDADVEYGLIIDTMDAARNAPNGDELFTKPFFGGIA